MMLAKDELYTILEQKAIYPVFQPIVSLETGTVLAYEALSRITIDSHLRIDELFQIAEVEKQVWRLEEICRKKGIKAAAGQIRNCKLFLNVDPEVLRDEKFQRGMTEEYLKKNQMEPEQVVFEVTERTSIKDPEVFCKIVEHYKNQGYQLAIDDFGVEYSGIGRVMSLRPHYLKIDMSIIQNIDKDSVKYNMVKSFATFCKSSNILLIAEGIETYDELSTLIELEIPFGQGYYLQRPDRCIRDISSNIRNEIKRLHKVHDKENHQVLVWDRVSDICEKNPCVTQNQKAEEVYEYFHKHRECRMVTVVDERGYSIGVVTRSCVNDLFGGRYGYTINMKKTVEKIMDRDFLEVDGDFSIVLVSQLAMGRDEDHIYDEVVITDHRKCIGCVSVKKLLQASISIQVGIAEKKNPLTGLPGNKSIEERVSRCINAGQPFSIAYLDLDNFKAYNDAYGFNNGDIMIKKVVSCMKEYCVHEEFIGHVGGDDFVIIANHYELEEKCKQIQKLFANQIGELYSKTDWDRGYIDSRNRNGLSETFPIASISIAIITNREKSFGTLDEFSKKVAKLKKAAKKEKGNSIQVI